MKERNLLGKYIEQKKLGEAGEFVRGNNLTKKDLRDDGKPCIHYGQIYTKYGFLEDKTISYIDDELYEKLKKAPKGSLIIATTSENVEDLCKSVVWDGNEPVAIGGHSSFYKHEMDPKYVGYFFRTNIFRKQKNRKVVGIKVKEVSVKKMAEIIIPVPSLEVQKDIVSKLDKFDSIINDFKSGIPAEIEARRKQYEYYRKKLLTFDEVSLEQEDKSRIKEIGESTDG